MSAVLEAEITAPIIYANPTPITLERRLKRGIYSFDGDVLYKRCGRCRDDWPADSEFFYVSSNMPDGLLNWCKACYQEWRYPNGRKQRGFPAKSTLLPEQPSC